MITVLIFEETYEIYFWNSTNTFWILWIGTEISEEQTKALIKEAAKLGCKESIALLEKWEKE